MDYRRMSLCRSHNLEVLGSSPSWSTKKIKELAFAANSFFYLPPQPTQKHSDSKTQT